MSNTYVFFHVFTPATSPREQWQGVIRECMSALLYSGLYSHCKKVIVGANCPNGYGEQWIKEYFAQFGKVEIQAINHAPRAVEWTTLQLLKERAGEYDNCVYMHSKNASRYKGYGGFELNEKWRYFMLAKIIRDWRICLDKLSNADIVGCSWVHGTHFQGNYWWATTEHIRKLPYPQQLFSDNEVKRKWLNEEKLNVSIRKAVGDWVKADWELQQMRYVCEVYTYLTEPSPKFCDLTGDLQLWSGNYDLNKYL